MDSRTALVVIDMQNGFLSPASAQYIDGAASTVPACAAVIQNCRARGIPVFFVIRSYRADGSVGSVSADVVKINALENELRGRINERLSAIEDKDVGVSIGSLTGIPFLNSRGFTVRMIFQVEGSAEVRLTGGLETAGINQTRHLLRLEVECSVIAQLPGYSERVETKGEYVVSETVIVGNVPSGFYSG